MSITKPSLPKGTRDFSPVEMVKRNYIYDTIKTVFKKYGYAEIQTPSMENLQTLTGKYGDEGDKLIFKILNSGEFLNEPKKKSFDFAQDDNSNKLVSLISEKALRYDLTVPFARYVVMHQSEISFPFKRFQVQQFGVQIDHKKGVTVSFTNAMQMWWVLNLYWMRQSLF